MSIRRSAARIGFGCILKQELSTAKTYEHTLLQEKSVVDRHPCKIAAKFGLAVDADHSKFPTLYG